MLLRIPCFIALICLAAGDFTSTESLGCCAVFRSGQPVVNADQTVIMIWDAAAKTQHFIRQASFKSAADDFGFLVPSPSEPELDESGNDAFAHLRTLTEPEKKKAPRGGGGIGCGCSARNMTFDTGSVHVLQEKRVAGFDAVVLESNSAAALTAWLKERGYTYSPEVEAWAKPYIDLGWKITALKIAKDADSKNSPTVAADALRMSFKTDRPLFPYREPDPKAAAELLVQRRLLRIYFLADARYQGEMNGIPWSGKVAWAGKINAHDRREVLKKLKLPETTGPADWYLTEFEDDWQYAVAPADVFFSRNANQDAVKRDPIYVLESSNGDAWLYAFAVVLIAPLLLRGFRRRPQFGIAT